MRYLFLSLYIPLLIVACQPVAPAKVEKKMPVSFRFQPYQGVNSVIATQVYNYIRANSSNGSSLLPVLDLPVAAYVGKLKRYKADSIIAILGKEHREENAIVVGLTHVDIETHLEGKEHWGIMGLGYCPGNAAIISTFRLQKGAVPADVLTARTINVCLHEMGHTFSLPHCRIQNCLMRAAHGHLPSDTVGQFCSECLRTLHQNGWKYQQPPTTYSQHTENK